MDINGERFDLLELVDDLLGGVLLAFHVLIPFWRHSTTYHITGSDLRGPDSYRKVARLARVDRKTLRPYVEVACALGLDRTEQARWPPVRGQGEGAVGPQGSGRFSSMTKREGEYPRRS